MSHKQVLVGCDGVTSVVAKWLGFKQPSLTGRSAIRGCAYYKEGHNFEPKFYQLVGNGVRYGIVPCDDNAVYWFFTWSPSAQGMLLLTQSISVIFFHKNTTYCGLSSHNNSTYELL